MTVNKMVGDTFDAIVELFPKIIPDAKINSDGWWSFIGPYGKSKVKFNQNKSLGILDHQYVDEESSWNIPMCIIQHDENNLKQVQHHLIKFFHNTCISF